MADKVRIPKASEIAGEPPTFPITWMSGRGVDIGTANIAVARYHVQDKLTPDGEIKKGVTEASVVNTRDCFLTFPVEEASSLATNGVDFHEASDGVNLLIVGEDALPFATAMGVPLRRPLAKGFISDKEDLSKEVVTIILKALLGEPMVPKELVVFSIPGMPIEGDTSKTSYHTRFFSSLLRDLGYDPMPLNEAMAVCYSALGASEGIGSKEGAGIYTGLTFSFGAGMVNVALSFKGMLLRSFSLPLGGDFIDDAVAKATNTPLSQVTALKEEGVVLVDLPGPSKGEILKAGTLRDPKAYHDDQSRRQAEAISLMYRELLTKLQVALAAFLSDPANRVDIKDTIPVIVSGGTAMADGFLQLFNELVLQPTSTRLSLANSAILANNPMSAVAFGALHSSMMRKSRVITKA